MKPTLIYLFIGIVAFTALKLRHQSVNPDDLKDIIIEQCKTNDSPECVSAVNEQFDSCLKRYDEEWNTFKTSRTEEEENQATTALGNKLTACIIDKDGEPFFTFDEEEDEN